ncbi:damage-control phosphatase ARMT1 family protein [Microcoleus sp. AS-A8]
MSKSDFDTPVKSFSSVKTGKPVTEQENLLGSPFRQPRLPLPPPMMMSEEGSFAYFTLTQRMPAIVQRVIDENDFPTSIVNNLASLIQSLPNGIVRSLDDEAPDLSEWNQYLQPYIGQRWLDIPWFFAEAYFFRRILEATHYFQAGSTQDVDPFALQKRRGLETTLVSIRELSTRVNHWIEQAKHDQGNLEPKSLIALLYSVLWGNRADMSLWPIDAGELDSSQEIHLEQNHILVDDTALIAERVARFEGVRMDVIVDNAGLELVCDLCVVDFLLTSHAAEVIYLHLKSHPMFVSDAMIQDVQDTIEFLATTRDPDVQSLAQRLQDYLDQGRLLCREDTFWTSPLVFWEMPEPLRQELAQSTLILIKGDANYRRCLGNRTWPFTTAFADIVCYFPAPLVALRTLKSELVVGLGLEQIAALNQEDSEWLTNGQWGVIQFVDPTAITAAP